MNCYNLLAIFLVSLFSSIQLFSQTLGPNDWYGFYEEGNDRWDLGTGSPGFYQAAIFVNGRKSDTKDKQIDAVRLFIRNTEHMSDLKLWVSEKVHNNPEDNDVCISLDLSQIKGGNDEFGPGLPNEITLPTPYPITKKGVYVGYSFNINYVRDNYDYDNYYPLAIACDVPTDRDGLVLYLDDTWYAGEMIEYVFVQANLCTQVHLTDASSVADNICDVYETERYDLTGKRITEPIKGINIVIYSDGRVEKELVP